MKLTNLTAILLGVTLTIASCNHPATSSGVRYFPLANTSFPADIGGNENIGNNVRRTSQVGDVRPAGCQQNCRHTRGDSYTTLDRQPMTVVAIADGMIARQSDWQDLGTLLNGRSRTAGGVLSYVVEIQGIKYLVRHLYLDPQASDRFPEGQQILAGTPISTLTGGHPGTAGIFMYIEIYFRDKDGKLQTHPNPLQLLRGANARRL